MALAEITVVEPPMTVEPLVGLPRMVTVGGGVIFTMVAAGVVVTLELVVDAMTLFLSS